MSSRPGLAPSLPKLPVVPAVGPHARADLMSFIEARLKPPALESDRAGMVKRAEPMILSLIVGWAAGAISMLLLLALG